MLSRVLRTMRAHQRAAFAYTLKTKHPALFMEMRLGKCLIVLRRCKMYRPRYKYLRILIVAPNSAMGGWEDDCKKERVQTVTLFDGSSSVRKKRLTIGMNLEGPVAFLLNKEGWQALGPEITRIPWDAVVADESTFLKNPKAKVTKFFNSNFRDVPHRWILAGLPAPEGEEDYFEQFRFLDGCFMTYNSFWKWRSAYMRPSWSGYGWDLVPGAADSVRRAVGRRAFVLRRQDVFMTEQKVYENRYVDLEPTARKMYRDIEDNFELPTGETTIYTMTVWSWLRQLCGGHVKDNANITNFAKVRTLLDLLKGELKGEKVVVYASYLGEIALIQRELNAAKIPNLAIHGDVPVATRNQYRRLFETSPEPMVFISQPVVAQMGMDLSCSDTCIYYSEPVELLLRRQTEDRLVSVPKVEKGTPILYLTLITRGTVDEDVHAALEAKAKNADLSIQRALTEAIRRRRAARDVDNR